MERLLNKHVCYNHSLKDIHAGVFHLEINIYMELIALFDPRSQALVPEEY